MAYQIKNWTTYQHYNNRRPTWIKLSLGLLDDADFQRLPVAARELLPMLWLMAAEDKNGYKDGIINGGAEHVAWRLRRSTAEISKLLKTLIDTNFLQDDSDSLADCYQFGGTEKRREEKRRDREDSKHSASKSDVAGFDGFWKAYPNKVGKGQARKSWKKIKPSAELVTQIVNAVESQKKSERWTKENGQYIPNPSTWLNQERWEDEIEPPKPPTDTPAINWAEVVRDD